MLISHILRMVTILSIVSISISSAHAAEIYFIDKGKIADKTEARRISSSEKGHSLAGVGTSATQCSSQKQKGSSGFVIPHLSGSIARELEETGLAVMYLEFKLGEAKILPEHLPYITEIQEALEAHPGWELVIEGHTDASGRSSWNKKLSLLRAQAVLDELVARGISPDRLSCVGWGSERPLDKTDSIEAHARNRRVELHRK